MGSIILGGGQSSRLGQAKLSLVIEGKGLLEQTIDRLGQLGEDIILVLAQDQEKPNLSTSPPVKIVTDLYYGKGPLVGIHSGLRASGDEQCVAVACDMPFLNIDLLRYMKELSEDFDVVIPKVEGELEPLHAIYSKNCLPVIEDMIARDDLRIRHMLERVRVRYLEEDEIDPFDPAHLSWFNINTPQDLQRAQEITNRKGESNDPS
ncbi:MAG: molybdenum cofactor guanylyltransferase [Dehalococcoidia bacterium]